MAEQWFIDESKSDGLLFAVIAIQSSDVANCRWQMRKLASEAGGSILHFVKERDTTRAAAYRAIAEMPITVILIHVPSTVRHNLAREQAINYVIQRATQTCPRRIVFELDIHALKNDRKLLQSGLKNYRDIEYQHLGKGDDPLLWVADGIAWAVQRGGRWLAGIEHLIADRVEL